MLRCQRLATLSDPSTSIFMQNMTCACACACACASACVGLHVQRTIRTITEPFLERSAETTKTSPMQLTTGEFVRVVGLRDVMETFCTTGLLPSEQTGVGWGRGGSSAVGLDKIGELEDTVATMVTAWEARGSPSISSTSARL